MQMIDIDELKRDREAGTPDANAVWGHHQPGRFTIKQCYADAARRVRVPDLEAAYIALVARVDILAAALQQIQGEFGATPYGHRAVQIADEALRMASPDGAQEAQA